MTPLNQGLSGPFLPCGFAGYAGPGMLSQRDSCNRYRRLYHTSRARLSSDSHYDPLRKVSRAWANEKFAALVTVISDISTRLHSDSSHAVTSCVEYSVSTLARAKVASQSGHRASSLTTTYPSSIGISGFGLYFHLA